ncbi:MAG: S53 family serine peptidase [Polyangia bacterium]
MLGAVLCTDGAGCGEPTEPAAAEEDRPPSDSALDREDGVAVDSDAAALEVAEEVSGTETKVAAPYWPHGVDQGTVDPDKRFRALIVLQLRNKAELEDRIAAMYSPSSSQFRQYMTFSEFMDRHAPTLTTVSAVKSWLSDHGFEVRRTARNRLVLSYTGTVRQFNAAFGTRLHLVKRSSGTWRAAAYAPITSLDVPDALVGKIRRLLMPDPEAATGTLSRDIAPVVTSKPSNVGDHLTPQQIARAYGMSSLYVKGYKGAGLTLGIIGATLFKISDLQSMWQAFGIRRADPIIVQTMEPIITRDLEATLDVELAGAIAPGAEIVYYGGPDNSDTSLLYTFNEAIGAARAQVLSDSFAHSEYTTPYPVARAYNESAMMAAALGITVLSASGDSAQVDVPSDAPYVTAVGGTNIELTPDGYWESERSWGLSGCGRSRLFALPTWQSGAYSDARDLRTVADVSTVVGPYWVKYPSRTLFSATGARLIDGLGSRWRPRVPV